MNPTVVIQEYLESNTSASSKVTEKCVYAVEAIQHIKWKKYFRLIAVLRKRAEYAIVVFSATKLKSGNVKDLKILEAFPFNKTLKLLKDESRYTDDDNVTAKLTGEDFVIGDLDPLYEPVSPTTLSGVKELQLDFLPNDFKCLVDQINSLLAFAADEENFCSFDWLNKLKESCFINNNDSSNVTDAELMTHSEYDSKSKSNHQTLIESTNSNFYKNSKLSADTRGTKPLNQQSMNDISSASKLDFDRNMDKTLSLKDHKNQSTPDLLDGFQFEKENRSHFSINLSGDKQTLYIERKLKNREQEYCDYNNYLMFIGTWNVNGRIDDYTNISKWLEPMSDEQYPHFYVIGFQELDISISSVALNRAGSNLEDRWVQLIESSIPFQKRTYRRIEKVRMAGIMLLVYIDCHLLKHIHPNEIRIKKVATGMFSVMPNKGAVYLKFRIFDSNIAFLNCHLAAGENNRMRRDNDFKDIEKELQSEENSFGLISIYEENDFVFLFGDLNYRLINLDASTARKLTKLNDIRTLLDKDELWMNSDHVFNKFHEGKINFLPTYKFETNTDNYDTGEKNRIPSYCDRIMWYGNRCVQLKYNSIMDYRSSDHKPVYSWFKIGLKKIVQEKKMKVYEAIIRNVDLMFNSSLPQATFDRQEIFLEMVHFYEYRQASIMVSNTGQYDFDFGFKEIPGCPRIPDWLAVEPSKGTINPGESCQLIFQIFVNANNVKFLNTQPKVECILVLELLNGKDFFITVSVELVPTSFGLPLSFLATVDVPIATIHRDELYEKIKPYLQKSMVPVHNRSTVPFKLPKEIFVMVDYLYKNIQEEELFARPGTHVEIQCIREQLDTKGSNADLSSYSVHSVTEALLMFLTAFYFPVVPNELTGECIGVYNNFNESVKVIAKLPLDHQNLFHYITSFLRKVLEKKTDNKTELDSLALLFVDLLFRPTRLESAERLNCAQFIKQFIMNDPSKYFRNQSTT